MNNEQLRSKAKTMLGGKLFGETWLTMALICLLYGIIVGLGSSLSVGFGDEGQFRFSYGSIIGFVLGGAMSYGLARVTVNLGRGGSAKIENLFDGFKENFTQAMILGMVKDVLIMLWSLLLIVPGIMKAYSYSMAPFIQQDADNKEWKHCLVTSKEVMDGKRKQLFRLDVGFIPYYLLGLICLGVGALWVAPGTTPQGQISTSKTSCRLFRSLKKTPPRAKNQKQWFSLFLTKNVPFSRAIRPKILLQTTIRTITAEPTI